jgi:hypothetical protein
MGKFVYIAYAAEAVFEDDVINVEFENETLEGLKEEIDIHFNGINWCEPDDEVKLHICKVEHVETVDYTSDERIVKAKKYAKTKQIAELQKQIKELEE